MYTCTYQCTLALEQTLIYKVRHKVACVRPECLYQALLMLSKVCVTWPFWLILNKLLSHSPLFICGGTTLRGGIILQHCSFPCELTNTVPRAGTIKGTDKHEVAGENKVSVVILLEDSSIRKQ